MQDEPRQRPLPGLFIPEGQWEFVGIDAELAEPEHGAPPTTA